MQYPASGRQQYKVTVRVLVVGSLLSVHATFTYLPVASQLGNYCSESQTELIITETLLSWWHLAQNFLSFPLLQIFLKSSDSKQFFRSLLKFHLVYSAMVNVVCVQVRGMNQPSPTHRFKKIKSRDSFQTMVFYNYGLTYFKSMLCYISLLIQLIQKPVS